MSEVLMAVLVGAAAGGMLTPDQTNGRKTMIDERFDRLMSPREVAAALSVDPTTVSRWAAAGRLRSIRTPGGHHRFFERDVLALLTPEDERK